MKKEIFLPMIVLGLSILIVFLLSLLRNRNNRQMKGESISLPTRPAAVAGTFYPRESEVLENQIKQLLQETKIIDQEGKAKILVVPHAGLEYSGRVAAWGFKQIAGQNYSRVILLGASHHHWFTHAAVYSEGWWETPLGKVEIDRQLASQIIDKEKNILPDKENHAQEHCLEIELVFLQETLSHFKIVPILISNPDENLKENLAQKIAQSFDEQTLLIISTDLSHYPPAEIAVEADRTIIEGILTGKQTEFKKSFVQVQEENYPGLQTPACGHEAIEVGLRAGELLGVLNYRKIKYENSGKVSGDRSRVVGYVAIVGYGQKTSEQTTFLDRSAQKEALQLARQTLQQYLTQSTIPSFTPQNPVLKQKLGAFVTLRKNGQLRGCIGRFEPDEPLWQVIQRMVIAAATQDYRFPPVKAEELDKIKIEISVMTPKKRLDDWRKIRLGKDGVVIEKGNRGGTFLPQVATETGWSLEEFLSQLCSQKAGLPPNCYQDPQTTIYVFQAQVFEEE